MKVFMWLLFILVLLAIGAVVGRWTSSRQPPVQPTAQVTTVRTVVVGITGDTTPFTVIPDPVITRQGDTLSWIHPTADSLTIDLTTDPTGIVPTTDSLVFAGPGGTATTVIRADAPAGNYKYVIIVTSGGATQRMDPRVIVEEGGR
jgi:hypothetical protein